MTVADQAVRTPGSFGRGQFFGPKTIVNSGGAVDKYKAFYYNNLRRLPAVKIQGRFVLFAKTVRSAVWWGSAGDARRLPSDEVSLC